MKHLKLYENYENDTIRVFRGTDEKEAMEVLDGKEPGYFFSSSTNFAEGYGNYIIEAHLNPDNVFVSYDKKDIKKLYDAGFQLTDNYLNEEQDGDTHPSYDFENNYYPTYEDYILQYKYSDTWQMIEESDGVMNWIMYHYGVVLITEGGVENYYTDNPSKYVAILNVSPR